MKSPAYAIQVKNLFKCFKMYSTPKDMLKEFLTGRCCHKEFWALKDISLTIKRGEVVGIMGVNGAGKSTLLRILAGTLDKTGGEVHINGKISAILELGSGFNPEYTGRENIINGGLCLGMSHREIEAKMNDIIDFSELADYIDQPFKTYSSGMQARLTFATAISVEPDILIIDEALSVGDAAFQHKCFARMHKLRANNTTILFVSHDTNAIASFCNTAVLMNKGCIICSGDTKTVIADYYDFIYAKTREQQQTAASLTETSSTPKGHPRIAHIVDAGIVDKKGKAVEVLKTGSCYRFFIQTEFLLTEDHPQWGLSIQDARGVLLYGNDTHIMGMSPAPCKKGETRTVFFTLHMHLASGSYFFIPGIGNASGLVHDANVAGIRFEVASDEPCHSYCYLSMNAEFSEQ